VDVSGFLISPAAISEVSLPKSVRGFDEAATRKFLLTVADTVQALMDERDKLRRSLSDAAELPRPAAEDPAALGNVLLAAQRAGEELVAHARATADEITTAANEARERLLEETQRTAADTERELDERRATFEREHARLREEIDGLHANLEAERQSVVAQARAEAEAAAAESHERLDALHREEEELRNVMAGRRREFTDMLQSALGLLDSAPTEGSETQHELTTILGSRIADARPERGETTSPQE
jgi:cell division septum initiation protein DivIVA